MSDNGPCRRARGEDGTCMVSVAEGAEAARIGE